MNATEAREKDIVTVTDDKQLLVSELYDKVTVQGEGPFIGRPCTFMRLGGCNLQCGLGADKDPTIWKCDSSYTWDWTGINGIRYKPHEQLGRISIGHIVNWLRNIHTTTKARMLVITGGEPLLQDVGIAALLQRLWLTSSYESWWNEWTVTMETNGTLEPAHCGPYISHFSVSPKLANSGNPLPRRLDWDVLWWFAHNPKRNNCFKFVASAPSDFGEIDEIVKRSGMSPDRVFIMPEGITDAAINEHLHAVVQSAIDRGYSITTRLHITLFGNTRGT